MKRIIPFAPLYTVDEYGRVFGPTGTQLDYEVRQNRFGDVLTVAIGEGDQMSWHPVIDLVSMVHFGRALIVSTEGSKLLAPTRFVTIEGARSPEYWDKERPKQEVVTEIWYWYKSIGGTVTDAFNALQTLNTETPYSMCLKVVRCALIAGIRE